MASSKIAILSRVFILFSVLYFQGIVSFSFGKVGIPRDVKVVSRNIEPIGSKLKPHVVKFSSREAKAALSRRFSSIGGVDEGAKPIKVSNAGSKFAKLNMFIYRTAWVSWWFQIVLSVISIVILTFANTVRQSTSSLTIWGSGFAFSTVGVLISLANCLLTWNIKGTSRRVAMGKIEESKIISTFRRYFRISVATSLAGMFLTLLGAEQIVGTLASKVLLSQGLQGSNVMGFVPQQNAFQPLDIFLVQANTNTMVAHFVPLVCYLWIQIQPALSSPVPPLEKETNNSKPPKKSNKKSDDEDDNGDIERDIQMFS